VLLAHRFSHCNCFPQSDNLILKKRAMNIPFLYFSFHFISLFPPPDISALFRSRVLRCIAIPTLWSQPIYEDIFAISEF
jgi:hypothetical protein